MHWAIHSKSHNSTNDGQYGHIINWHPDVPGVIQNRNANITCLPGQKKTKQQKKAFVGEKDAKEIRFVLASALVQHRGDNDFLALSDLQIDNQILKQIYVECL